VARSTVTRATAPAAGGEAFDISGFCSASRRYPKTYPLATRRRPPRNSPIVTRLIHRPANSLSTGFQELLRAIAQVLSTTLLRPYRPRETISNTVWFCQQKQMGGTPMMKFWFAAPVGALLVVAIPAPVFAQGSDQIALENDYVRVSRDAAPCAAAAAGRCEDRVILAMGDIELAAGGASRKMKYGEIAVFSAGQSYQAPTGRYFEIAVKPGHPPIKSPPELIPPPKNLLVFEGRTFFIYEEKLAVGDTRPRHSHSQRVEIRLNQGPQLMQQIWRDGAVRQQHPPIVNWREPVIHEVKNVGDMALRNFILEFLPERREGSR
jgi:hypothetical protein